MLLVVSHNSPTWPPPGSFPGCLEAGLILGVIWDIGCRRLGMRSPNARGVQSAGPLVRDQYPLLRRCPRPFHSAGAAHCRETMRWVGCGQNCPLSAPPSHHLTQGFWRLAVFLVASSLLPGNLF